MNKSTIILLLTALLANGCIFDSGDDLSENNLLTPFTLNITGDWNFELDEDTTFRYSSRVNSIFISEERIENELQRRQTRLFIEADNNNFEDRKRFLVALTFNEIQPKPGTYNLNNDDTGRVQMTVRVDMRKQFADSLISQHFEWIPHEGRATVTRYNNNLLQGTYEFTGNLTEGREHVIDNNSNIIRDVKFDSIKKAVFIEGRFDVDMSESDDN